MKMMKHLACGAFAVALAAGISGCGSKEQTYAGPKVAEGTIAAIAARLPENTSLSSLCKQYGLSVADLMKKISDKDAQEIIKELELDKAQTKWLAVNISEVSAAKIEKGEPDFAVAIATTVDLDKAIAAGDKKKEFKKTTIAGVPAYEAGDSDKKSRGFMANLDKQLILVANSSAGLEKQIALYREGKGESKDFGAFALGANDILRVKLAKVGENVKKALHDPDMLKMVNQMIPDGDKIVQGLGTLELALGATGDGKEIKLDLSVDTAADADADKLVTFAKTGIMALTAQMKEGAAKDADAKMAYEALQAIKIENKGKTAKLSAATAADPALKALADKAKALK